MTPFGVRGENSFSPCATLRERGAKRAGEQESCSAYAGHFDSGVIIPPSESPALYTLARRAAPNYLAIEPKQNGL